MTSTAQSGSLAAPRLPEALRPVPPLVGLLLSADLLLMALHLGHTLDAFRLAFVAFKSPTFHLSSEVGLAESFAYVQLFWIALLLAWPVRRRARSAYLPWALSYACVLVGGLLGIQEPAVIAAAGIALLALLLAGYLLGDAPIRATYRWLAAGTVAVGALSVALGKVADVVSSYHLQELLYLLLGGAELVAISCILWYVLAERLRSQPDA